MQTKYLHLGLGRTGVWTHGPTVLNAKQLNCKTTGHIEFWNINLWLKTVDVGNLFSFLSVDLTLDTISIVLPTIGGPGSAVGIATGYGLDGPEDLVPVGARFSAPVQTGPGDHPASCTMGTGSFQGVKIGRGVTLTLMVPWSWKGRVIPLLSLWAVQPVQSLSACTRVTFTFTLLPIVYNRNYFIPPVGNIFPNTNYGTNNNFLWCSADSAMPTTWLLNWKSGTSTDMERGIYVAERKTDRGSTSLHPSPLQHWTLCAIFHFRRYNFSNLLRKKYTHRILQKLVFSARCNTRQSLVIVRKLLPFLLRSSRKTTEWRLILKTPCSNKKQRYKQNTQQFIYKQLNLIKKQQEVRRDSEFSNWNL